MDLRKLNYKKGFKIVIAATGIAGFCGGLFVISKPLWHEFQASFAMKEFRKFGVMQTYRQRYHLFFEKLDNLATADLHEEVLIHELAEARRDLEVERAKSAEAEFLRTSNSVASKLKKKAGSHLARLPEGLNYEVPSNMQSYQLLVLGMEYFRKKDFEKSAVIFDDLMNRKEESNYQRADHYLVTAISWYKIKNFEMAAKYLQRAEKSAEKGGSFYRQALLWKSMVRHSVGDHHGAQKILTQLLSYHPDSDEAELINGKRKPASHAPVAEEDEGAEVAEAASAHGHAKEHAHEPKSAHDAHGGSSHE